MGIKKYLRKIPGVVHAVRFARDPRGAMQNVFQGFNFFLQYHGLGKNTVPGDKGALLVVSLMGDALESTKFESLFVKSIQTKGFEPTILTRRGALSNWVYKALGVRNFLYFEDYLDVVQQQHDTTRVSEELFENCCDLNSLMTIEYRGVKIGKYAASTVLRQTHSGEVDFNAPEFLFVVKQYVKAGVETVLAADRIFDDVVPIKVLFLERGYSPYGEFFDLAINHGCDTIQWIGCHTSRAVMAKRYNRTNKGYHPSSLSSKSWEQIKNLPWNPVIGEQARSELFKTYASGEWFNEVGTQFNTAMLSRESICKQLELDPDKKVGIIFAHILWDATFFYGEDLFTDYKEWLVETVKEAAANTSMNWVIKIHPANVIKKHRENYQGRWAEIEAVETAMGQLPSHIKWLLPDTSISTFSLFEVMDYCITVRGTIGMEAALFGVPVLTAGTGRYDGHGFTLDSDSRESYLEKISTLQDIPPLLDKEKQLAERFAHGIFCLRPLPLKSIRVNYAQNAVATMTVGYKFKNMEAWTASEDFRRFGDWAALSQDEDFLNPDVLQSVYKA